MAAILFRPRRVNGCFVLETIVETQLIAFCENKESIPCALGIQ